MCSATQKVARATCSSDVGEAMRSSIAEVRHACTAWARLTRKSHCNKLHVTSSSRDDLFKLPQLR